MDKKEKVLTHLATWEIPFEIREHAPADSIETALNEWQGMKGTFCKNIFLRNYKGTQHYLVIIEHHKTTDTRLIEKIVGGGRVSFASPERMNKYLGLAPGSVSPFGLINDLEKHTILFIDEELKNSDFVNFHPNDNTATLTISGKDFFRFIDKCGNKYHFVKFL